MVRSIFFPICLPLFEFFFLNFHVQSVLPRHGDLVLPGPLLILDVDASFVRWKYEIIDRYIFINLKLIIGVSLVVEVPQLVYLFLELTQVPSLYGDWRDCQGIPPTVAFHQENHGNH